MQSEISLPFLNCDPKNEQRSFDCIQRYLASKINCTFPWLKKHSSQELKQCNKSSELYQHIETYMKVLQRQLDHEVEAFGCLKKNCVENKFLFLEHNLPNFKLIFQLKTNHLNHKLHLDNIKYSNNIHR